MMNSYAMEVHDISRIRKLNGLTNPDTFWDDVRKLTKRITSDHSIRRWQCLAEERYRELTELPWYQKGDLIMTEKAIAVVRVQLQREYSDYYCTVFYGFIDEAIENSWRDNGRKPFKTLEDLHNHIKANYI